MAFTKTCPGIGQVPFSVPCPPPPDTTTQYGGPTLGPVPGYPNGNPVTDTAIPFIPMQPTTQTGCCGGCGGSGPGFSGDGTGAVFPVGGGGGGMVPAGVPATLLAGSQSDYMETMPKNWWWLLIAAAIGYSIGKSK